MTHKKHVIRVTACIFSIAGMVGTAITQAGPVVHLTFDDSANLGLDSSGNGNNGTIFNTPTFDAGGISLGAAAFNGQDHISWDGETNPVEDLLEGPFTFSVWVKTTQIGGGGDMGFAFQGAGIVWADISGTPAPPLFDTIPMALTGTKLSAFVGPGPHIHSTTSISTGQWVHIVVFRNTAQGGYRGFFVNGAPEAIELYGSGDLDLSGLNRVVLGGNVLDSRYFNGLLDDFQAYDRVLTQAEVNFLRDNPGMTVPDQAFGPGDMDCDGDVDLDDIEAFALALTDPDGYEAQFPLCEILNGDINSDLVVDGDDLQGFIDELLN